MTMNWRPVASSAPKSKTCTMFGCTSRAAASASRRKRETKFASCGQVLGEQLDRHVALQPRVERELHGRHAADAEAALEAVAVCEERVGGHPSSSGGTPPVPGGSSGVPRRRRRPGRRCGRLGRRRSASASRSASGVGVSVGVGVGVSVGVASPSASGVGVSSGSALALVRDPARRGGRATRAGSRLSSPVGPARQPGELPLGLARRARRARVALARGDGVAGLGDERGQLVGVVLRDQRGVVCEPQPASSTARPARPRGAGSGTHIGPIRLVESRSGSLPVLEALGERVRQPRGADRRLRAGDVVLGAAPLRGPAPACRAPARPRAGRRRAAGRSSRG